MKTYAPHEIAVLQLKYKDNYEILELVNTIEDLQQIIEMGDEE
jgi:hypothetical protein